MIPGKAAQVLRAEERVDASEEHARVVVHQQLVEPRLQARAADREQDIQRLAARPPLGVAPRRICRDGAEAPLRTDGAEAFGGRGQSLPRRIAKVAACTGPRWPSRR